MDFDFDIPAPSEEDVPVPAHTPEAKPDPKKPNLELPDAQDIEDARDKAKPGAQKFAESIRKQPMYRRIIMGRAAGEIVSMASAPGADMLVKNTVLNYPYSDLKERLCRNVIEPHLEGIDNFLSHAKSFDTPEMRKERHALPRNEQARMLTNQLVDQFGLKFTGSILGQYFTQDYFFRIFHAPVGKKVNAFSVVLDRGVQIGSMVMANTVAADQALAAQNGLTKILKNVGMQEEQAKDWANYTVNFTIPNLIAAGVSTGLLIQSTCRR